MATAVLLLALSAGAAAETYRITLTQLDMTAYPVVHLVASVMDAGGHAIRGLRAGDVVVTEDGRDVAPDVRLASEVAPVTVVFAVDASGSMAAAMADAKAAALSFVRTLGDADRAVVIAFNTSATVTQDLTGDRAAIEGGVARIAANGNTALYDALDRALQVAAAAPPQSRRAIVLLTDGVDNSSAATLDDVRGRIRTAALPVFLVGLGAQVDRPVLEALAGVSAGGRVLVAPNSAELLAVYDTLAEQLRSDLAISYRSSADPRPRTLAVEIRRDGQILARSETVVTPPIANTVRPAGTAIATRIAPAVTDTQTGDDDVPIGIGLLGATTAASLVMWVYVTGRERSRTERHRRLQEFVRPTVDAQTTSGHGSGAARASLRRAARPLRPFVPSRMFDRTSDWLVRAGEPLGLDAYEFIALRIAGAAAVGIALFVVMAFIRREPLSLGLAALIGVLLGYAIPGFLLAWRVRTRKRAMSRALPGALDMLALSTAAGLTLDGSFAQVASRWETALSVELRRYLAEVRVGRDRRDAVRALAQRVDLPEMSHLATVILQADILGVPIAGVLRDQASELRRQRRQHAEELARIAPVKMLFPMALLIFPALFVVILGPVVPVVLRAFAS